MHTAQRQYTSDLDPEVLDQIASALEPAGDPIPKLQDDGYGDPYCDSEPEKELRRHQQEWEDFYGRFGWDGNRPLINVAHNVVYDHGPWEIDLRMRFALDAYQTIGRRLAEFETAPPRASTARSVIVETGRTPRGLHECRKGAHKRWRRARSEGGRRLPRAPLQLRRRGGTQDDIFGMWWDQESGWQPIFKK
ncbi:hypothetical protein HYV74_01490 [Candidatus Uhrbacteria bacterium]|nr:hypothetical protein [Candidatus Uhrbacteria bacterium]